jgi:hypothetical protein
MKITVITLYRDEVCETYVGAVQGTVTQEQADQLAKEYKLKMGDLPDLLGFQEIEVGTDLPAEPLSYSPAHLQFAYPNGRTYFGKDEDADEHELVFFGEGDHRLDEDT